MKKAELIIGERSDADGSGTFIDERDGQTYRTVKMPDGKVWMAQNLNYKPESGGSFCYDEDESMGEKYGRLYNWKTANKVSPKGWHLPSREEWEELITVTDNAEDPWRLGLELKSKDGWNWDNDNDVSCNGTDDYGFSALPGGCWNSVVFIDAGYGGNWWTAEYGFFRRMYYNYGFVENLIRSCDGNVDDIVGFSVRCVKDD